MFKSVRKTTLKKNLLKKIIINGLKKHKAACLSHKGSVIFDPNFVINTTFLTREGVQYRINLTEHKYQKQTQIVRSSMRH